jgi:hypothetical protein
VIFSVVATPTAVHGLVRAARRAGVQPWKVGLTSEAALADVDPDLRSDHGLGPHHDADDHDDVDHDDVHRGGEERP